MGAFVSVGVSVYQSADSFVCFGAKPTQMACVLDFLRDRKKTKKGEVPGQSTEEGSQQKSGKVKVRKKRLLSEKLGPVDPEAGSANAR